MTTIVFLQATVNLIFVLSSILLGCLPKKFKYSRSHDHNPPQIHVKNQSNFSLYLLSEQFSDLYLYLDSFLFRLNEQLIITDVC